MSATSANPLPTADFPIRGSAREKLLFAAKRTTLAVAETERRSWEFRLRDSPLELLIPDQSNSRHEFSDDREMLITCGVVLEFLELILRHHGCMGRIDYSPSFDEPKLIARIHAAHGGERGPLDSRLFAALNSSAPQALQPAELAVSEITMDLLTYAGSRERSWVEFARSTASQERLRGLAASSNRSRVASVRVMNRKDIFPTNFGRSAGGWLLNRIARWRTPQLAVRIDSMEATQSVQPDAGESGGSAAMFAVLKTKTDDKRGWLAAGQTLGRIQLQASALGLGCAPRPAALRSPHLRAELRREFGHKGFVQAIVRFQADPRQSTRQPFVANHALSAGQSIRVVDSR